MYALVSMLTISALAVVIAWCAATALRSRRGVARSGAREWGRLLVWLGALALLRDHALRLHHEGAGIGLAPALIASAGALLMALALMSVEHVRWRTLAAARSLPLRDALSGIGVGACLSFVLLRGRVLQSLSVPGQSSLLLLVLLTLIWAFASELIFRGLFFHLARKSRSGVAVALASAVLSTLAWLGLACCGPYPIFAVLAAAAWISLAAAGLRLWIGFAAAVGVHFSLLLALLLPG